MERRHTEGVVYGKCHACHTKLIVFNTIFNTECIILLYVLYLTEWNVASQTFVRKMGRWGGGGGGRGVK